MKDEIRLTDLEVIQRWSIAVRGETADRAELAAALRADLAWVEGARRPKAAPAKAAPVKAAPVKAAPAKAASTRATAKPKLKPKPKPAPRTGRR